MLLVWGRAACDLGAVIHVPLGGPGPCPNSRAGDSNSLQYLRVD